MIDKQYKKHIIAIEKQKLMKKTKEILPVGTFISLKKRNKKICKIIGYTTEESTNKQLLYLVIGVEKPNEPFPVSTTNNLGIEVIEPSKISGLKLLLFPSIDNFLDNTSGVWKEVDRIPKEAKVLKQSPTGSAYHVCRDGDSVHIIRVSDHWGSGIGTCNWYLEGYPKRNSYNFEGGTKIGKIKLKDLSYIL
jgi:hypothetical protein